MTSQQGIDPIAQNRAMLSIVSFNGNDFTVRDKTYNEVEVDNHE